MKAYQRVYETLKTQIETAIYPTGTLLPPEPDLEKIFSVSRTTVRKAVSILAEEGYVQVKQGRGTSVIYGSPSEAFYKFHNVTGVQEVFTNASKPLTVHARYIDQIPANEEIAEALLIPAGTPVYRIQRSIYMDQYPLAFMENYVRQDLAPGLDQYCEELNSLYPLLEEKYGLKFYSGKEYVSAATAGFVEAKILNVSPGTSVLFCTRHATTQTLPLEFGRTFLRTDQYKLVVQMRGDI